MGIDWAAWLSTYGYWAIAIGTFLEGETILLAGAWAAHHGLLDIRGVAAAAVCGSFCGDQLYFLLGRIFGTRLLRHWPAAQRGHERVFRLLQRHQSAFILAFRFLYGLRTVAPFVLGASRLPARRFVPLNFLGATLWSCTIAFGGLAIGDALHRFAQGLHGPHAQVLAVSVLLPVALAVGIWWTGRRWAKFSVGPNRSRF